MPKYVINKTQAGIEIYFDAKPEKSVLETLKKNGWRWNGVKICWYAKYTTSSERLAKTICDQDRKIEVKNPKLTTRQRDFVSFTQSHSYKEVNIIIKKGSGEKFSVSTSDNLINCVDCKRTISIHSINCIFCGCPLNHTLQRLYDIKSEERDLELKKQNEEREIKYRNDHIKYLERKLFIYSQKHQKTLFDLPIDKFNLVISRLYTLLEEKSQLPILTEEEKMRGVFLGDYEYSLWLNRLKQEELIEKQHALELAKKERERKEKEKEEFNKKLEEVKILCLAFKLSYSQILHLCNSNTIAQIKERVSLISYYNANFNLNLGGDHLLMSDDELNKYLWARKNRGEF